MHGRPHAVIFGYTGCPDVCPTVLLDMSNALQDLGRSGSNLNVLFVSLDPENDTPARLAEYLSSFDNRIVGLTGDLLEVEAMAQAFHAHVERHASGSGTDHAIHHSTAVYLLDGEGRLVDEMLMSASTSAHVRQLRRLIVT